MLAPRSGSRLLAAGLSLCGILGAQAPVVGIWNFDETSGLVAGDSGPAANHGTLNGFTNDPAQWVPGVSGNALSFDGVNDYVELAARGGLPCFNGFGETFSICLWVMGTATDDDRILSFGSSSNNTPLFTLGTGAASQNQTDKLRVYVRNTQNYSSSRVSSATVFDGTWHHVAYVESAGRAALYVDGVRETGNFDHRFGPTGTRAWPTGLYGLDRIALGAVLRPSICCWFTGAIDSLRIYGSALSAADVVSVMGGGAPGPLRASLGEYGVGCGVGPLELWASGSAAIGGTGLALAMRGANGPGTAFVGIGVGIPAPLDLGALGYPGCWLYPNGATFLGLGTLDAQGSLPFAPFPIPADPSLAGVTITLQAIGATASEVALSNAVVAVLGH